jgi:hypothetical protein
MLALAAQSLALAVPPLAKMRLTEETMSSHLETRAPHFFEIREPASGYTLESPSPASANATGSFEFKALDGEQSSEYSCKVYLQSSSGDKQQVGAVTLPDISIYMLKVDLLASGGGHPVRRLCSYPDNPG